MNCTEKAVENFENNPFCHKPIRKKQFLGKKLEHDNFGA